MIINHRYKFIFLKTRKTAGTSLEIALSKFCGPDDIITPIVVEEDENIRRDLGYPGPRNYRIPMSRYCKTDWHRLLRRGRRKEFINHSEAHFVRSMIDPKIWDGYFKFCVERNPFDKAISRYYWNTREPRPSIIEYLNGTQANLLSNWDVYAINDHVVADFVARYENLSGDLAKIQERLGLPEKLELPNAKGNYRKNREHYSAVLDAESRARIELVCAKECAAFGYRWEENGR